MPHFPPSDLFFFLYLVFITFMFSLFAFLTLLACFFTVIFVAFLSWFLVSIFVFFLSFFCSKSLYYFYYVGISIFACWCEVNTLIFFISLNLPLCIPVSFCCIYNFFLKFFLLVMFQLSIFSFFVIFWNACFI